MPLEVREQTPRPAGGTLLHGSHEERLPCASRLCGTAASIYFALVLLITQIPAIMVTCFGMMLSFCSCGRKKGACFRALSRSVIYTFAVGARIAVALCCWISIKADGFADLRTTMGTSGRPVLIIANHASFFDIVLITLLLPLQKLTKIKMLVSHKLFKAPGLGQIVYCMGHLGVPNYRPDNDEAREKFRSVMRARLEEFEEHVSAGGYGGWFPEGKLNPGDTSKLLRFRKGGFQPAVRIDAELWCITTCGNAVSWPGKGWGGKPARIGARIHLLCDSTHSFLTAAGFPPGGNEEEACLFFAEQAQLSVQRFIDEFVAEGFVCDRNPRRGPRSAAEASSYATDDP